jgi:TolA-binding protein
MTSEQSAEDLLVKARSGELSEDEARRFQITVGASRELALLYRAGVALDEQAELLPGDEARMSALVAGALEELDAELSRGAPRPVRRRSNAWFFASSAACGMLLTVALASAWQLAERRDWFGLVDRAPAPPVAVVPLKRPAPATAAAAASAGSTTPATAVSALPAPRVEAAPPLARGAAKQAAASSSSTPATTAGEVFARANAARRSGDSAGAIALYEQLIALFPATVEAEDARVLVGNLRLGQRAPGAALTEFDKYSPGALTAEALWGRARALRGLGDRAEREALEQLMRDYPSSPYAPAARQRLQQLGE